MWLQPLGVLSVGDWASQDEREVLQTKLFKRKGGFNKGKAQ